MTTESACGDDDDDDDEEEDFKARSCWSLSLCELHWLEIVKPRWVGCYVFLPPKSTNCLGKDLKLASIRVPEQRFFIIKAQLLSGANIVPAFTAVYEGSLDGRSPSPFPSFLL